MAHLIPRGVYDIYHVPTGGACVSLDPVGDPMMILCGL